MTAGKLVAEVLRQHPDSPRALHSQARIYRILYNKLRYEPWGGAGIGFFLGGALFSNITG